MTYGGAVPDGDGVTAMQETTLAMSAYSPC